MFFHLGHFFSFIFDLQLKIQRKKIIFRNQIKLLSEATTNLLTSKVRQDVSSLSASLRGKLEPFSSEEFLHLFLPNGAG